MIELDLALHSFSYAQHYTHVPGFDVFALIARAAERGFAGVNINLNRPDWRHLSGRSPDHLRRVRERLESHGLSLEIDTSGTAPEHLRPLLEAARTLGARNLRTYTRHGGEPGRMVAKTLGDLREAAKVAEAVGVPLVLENHEEFSGPEVAAIVAAVGSPWLGALYDYGNAQMVLEDPLDCLAAMLPHTQTMHLKDHLMLRPEDSPDGRLSVLGVTTGSGCLPIVEITRRLIDAGHRRFVFENVWAYRAPVRRDARGTAPVTLGAGVFRYAEPPFDGALRPGADGAWMELAPAELVQGEARAVDAGLAWLTSAFAAAGWHLRARPLESLSAGQRRAASRSSKFTA